MKPNLLIIPAAIRSHVLLLLYVANGYRVVPHSGMLVGYQMRASFIVAQEQKPTYSYCLSKLQCRQRLGYLVAQIDSKIVWNGAKRF